MKRTLFLSVLFGMLLTTAHAENESHQQVESTLYAYYRWCNNNIRDTAVLSKADTLFRLSGEKHDIRMQAVALSLKADHYYFNNNLDSLKAWIPRVQDFARKNDQIKYYYFTWSRLILYYTKQAHTRSPNTNWSSICRRPKRTITNPQPPRHTNSSDTSTAPAD